MNLTMETLSSTHCMQTSWATNPLTHSKGKWTSTSRPSYHCTLATITNLSHMQMAACPTPSALVIPDLRKVIGRVKVVPWLPFWFCSLITEQLGLCLYRHTDSHKSYQIPSPPCLDGMTKTCGGNAVDHWGTLQSWPVGHSCFRGLGRPKGH